MNRSTKLAFAIATLAVAGLAVGASPDNKSKPNNNRGTGTKQPAADKPVSKPNNTGPNTTKSPSTPTGNVNKQIGTDPEHFTKLFKSIDTNNDGVVSVEEWNQLSPRIGTSVEDFTKSLNDPQHPKHTSMLRRFDANSNGKIDQSERETAIREWQNTLINALAAFDKDRDGTFSAEERAAFQVNASRKNPNMNAKRAANTNDENKNPSQPNTTQRQNPTQRRANVDEKNR